jgi:DNA helicase IV
MPVCEICGREVSQLTGHHLMPKKIVKRLKRRGREVIVVKSQTCNDCHKMLHSLFPLKDLAVHLNNIQKLKQNSDVVNYISWIKDKPEGTVKHPKRTWSGGKYE